MEAVAPDVEREVAAAGDTVREGVGGAKRTLSPL